ncbi:MAG: hypothetical protein HQ518_23395 [Rhodopirellula sp.]|nr:hypothetical protein [Rhodopirellula sp.]
MTKLTTFSTLLLLVLASSSLRAQDGNDPKPALEPAKTEEAADNKAQQLAADAHQAAEARFSTLLTGATLVGNFTIDSDGPVDPTQLLKPDRYELATVNKVKDDVWLFVYVHKGVPIPLTMKVLWAGTTPVLTLDEFTIAGMGTYSARLMFHDDRYAGTWKHGKKGGLMFGKIETAEFKKQLLTNPPTRVPPSKQSELESKEDN